MWLEQNPTYTRRLVRLPIRAHTPMKPKVLFVIGENGIGQVSYLGMALVRVGNGGWGESEYIHSLALVAKKNGKTSVCMDATGLNQMLEYANNNPPKIESLLF